MSVHTWTYKKVSALTDKEKKECVAEKLKEASKWWGFKYTFDELVNEVNKWFKRQPELFEYCGKTPEKYASDMLSEYKQYFDTIQNEGFDGVIKIRDHYKVDFIEYNGELYYKLGCDIPFRCRKYTEEKFTNKESLINYISKQDENMIGVYYDVEGFIIGFDTVLERINTFYKTHGENNILIEFG